MRILTVSELALHISALLGDDFALSDVWVRGEITNYTRSTAGHCYFSLKDEHAAVRCVLFAGHAAGCPPLRNGMAVLAHGNMSFYERRGDLQLYVDAVQDAGLGELHLRFERLKARLETEGLFDVARKRAIPACPATIGIVTSTAAAALRDILKTLGARLPLARVVLAPALVQGEGAAEQVARALDALNAWGGADVVIVARGGGSLEELWAFNEEVVARAIARSRVPVVTGIGHETDFTIADFVADLRAPTPTGAATMATPDAAAWRANLEEAREQLDAALQTALNAHAQALEHLRHRLAQASPERQIAEARRRARATTDALEAALAHLLRLRQEQLAGRALRLEALSPLATLARGFAVVRRAGDGALVARIAQVSPGLGLHVLLADGAFAAVAGPRLAAPADVTPAARGDDAAPHALMLPAADMEG